MGESEMLVQLTDKNFDQIVGEHKYVLVDFWSENCAPCHTFKKVIQQVAPDYPEFVFAEINVNEEQKLAEEFEIRAVPAVMILRNRAIIYADSGMLTRTTLTELLEQAKTIDLKE